MIAKTIETRDVNITNHAEKTDELCRITLAKCNETIASIELMVKNLGAQVDTKAIVKGVQNSLNPAFDRKIISPFIQHTEDLARTGDADAGENPGMPPTKPSPNGHSGFGKPLGQPVCYGAFGRPSSSPA